MCVPKWTFQWGTNGWLCVFADNKLIFRLTKKRLRHMNFLGDDIYIAICTGRVDMLLDFGNGEYGRLILDDLNNDPNYYIVADGYHSIGGIDSSLRFAKTMYEKVGLALPRLKMSEWSQFSGFTDSSEGYYLRGKQRISVICPIRIVIPRTASRRPKAKSGWLEFGAHPSYDIAITKKFGLIQITNHYNHIHLSMGAFVECMRTFGLDEMSAFVLVTTYEKL